VREVRAGKLPEQPYLVIGQQSLIAPTRAPHAVKRSTKKFPTPRVPSVLPGGLTRRANVLPTRSSQAHPRPAPGRQLAWCARSARAADLEARHNANVARRVPRRRSNAWNRQLLFRRRFPYFPLSHPRRTPLPVLVYSHPGAGVHGMYG